MKTCPVCKTKVFSDMDTCFGCMYQFGSKPELEQMMKQDKEVNLDEEFTSLAEDEPECLLPRADSCGATQWTVRLEIRNDSNPEQSWAIELIPPFEIKPKGGIACVEI